MKKGHRIHILFSDEHYHRLITEVGEGLISEFIRRLLENHFQKRDSRGTISVTKSLLEREISP